ncbi:MAG TPA: HDOD domain-containing protein [Phycisphaerae bacterium]|nr:HDOD domain-containing protein [Phycisphaerae bacterium]HQE42985.1 HDOD domain-containing protein [Phycisphaerae bacterium]
MTAIQTRGKRVPPEPTQAELVLAQVESLPTLPAVAVRLLELTTDDRSKARDIIQAVESDLSLSARLLALVRRAGIGGGVNTVDRAVVLLGLNAVRNLVLSAQIFEMFSHRKERAGARFNRVEFWKHSLAVGCAAKLLAEELAGCDPGGSRTQGGASATPVRRPQPEEAFICGLLHDIGKAVLDACFPRSYDRVVTRTDERFGCIADAERDIFGLDHALAGSRLAQHWKLPAMIAESIWLHHGSPALTPSRLAFPDHVRLVQVADRLVRYMRIGYSGNYSSDGPVEQAVAAIGLSPEALERVQTALPDLVEARAEFIGLGRLTSREVYEASLARANAELARLNESLADANRRLLQRSRCLESISALKTAVGDDPTHEQVSRAAAQALLGILNTDRVVVVAYSRCRELVTIAGARMDADDDVDFSSMPGEGISSDDSRTDGEDAGGVCVHDAMPAWDAGNLGFVAEGGRGWLPANLLPSSLLDRITAALQAPATWCFPIRNQHGFAGALLVAGEKPGDSDEVVPVMADWIGTWLGSAESTLAARRLSEELAEMSQQLLESQADLARARSLVMIGDMAAGAAHELNNPLAVISGRAQLLNREGVDEEVRKAAALIAEHAHRASGMVNELMEFAKPPAPKPGIWDLSTLLNEVRQAWIDKKALSDVEFRIEIPPGLPKVQADHDQIRVVFDEIIRNAVEAMHNSDVPSLVINCCPDVSDEKVVIRIQDNGCGMTPEVLERAMAPFFSHRPAGRGRGLGLSRAARLAEINGGRLRLFSRHGEGTQAILELPAAVGHGS